MTESAMTPDSPQRSKIKGDVRKILEWWATAKLPDNLENALVDYIDLGRMPKC